MSQNSAVNLILESINIRGTTADITGQVGLIWELIRTSLIVPLLRVAVYICLVMSLMVSFEKFYMGITIILVKLLGWKPEKRHKWEPLEIGNAAFPMVLVQIPMFNEKEVYKISIRAACKLSWPSDRIIIQVLDDSTDPVIKDMIEKECQTWASKGINCIYQIRKTRGGYKAGALREGLKHDYVKGCEYVAIFDADFRPEPDFLQRAIPFLIHNSDIAVVQGRWRFVNADECLLTRLQEMSLDYHFKVEQEMGSSAHAFFAFNGTGGIWRISAIHEAGGWKDRTTVEDLDLSVRAVLKGWKFVYLGDLQVKSELPSTFKAFRLQQHRWCCGPANLFRKIMMEIVRNKRISLWKKIYLIYNFFLVRKLISHTVIFFFYCVVLPFTILVPEVDVPNWGLIYIPVIITTLNTLVTPRSMHLLFFYWMLFENMMSLHRTKATSIGLLEAKGANEWVVTEKMGDAVKNNFNVKVKPRTIKFKIGDRVHLPELGFAVFFFFCGCYDFLYGKKKIFIYLFLQVITFTIAGFGNVGTIGPT
ncbi:hypothetical protein ACH5RR_030142 [Cinchona calisaya]|uniref:glucomannan 4-beta-mannosyltransferase n=1 Tax=Cinchona calisaya TaxID=153742 RepID=A0ABD2YTQ5_9GENT